MAVFVNTVCGSPCAHQCGCLCNTAPFLVSVSTSLGPSQRAGQCICVWVCECVPQSACEFANPHPGPACAFVRVWPCACESACGLSPWPCQHVTLCTRERQSVSLRTRLWARVSVGPSQCVSVSACVSGCPAAGRLPSAHRGPARRGPGPAPPPAAGKPPRGGRGRGARLQVPTCPRRAGPWRHAGAGRGTRRAGAGRGGRRAGRGSAGRPETRREPHASGRLAAAAAAAAESAAAARTRTRLQPKREQQQPQPQQPPLQLEQQ